jgi:hypothetical protein
MKWGMNNNQDPALEKTGARSWSCVYYLLGKTFIPNMDIV